MKNIFSAVGVTTAMAICSASSFADEDRRMQVDQDSLRDTDVIVKGYEEGKTILFDLSSEELKEEKKAVMSTLSGMVIGDQKMVYLKKGPQGSQFLVLEKQMRAEKQARAIEKFENAQQPSTRTRRSVSTRAATPPLDESGTLKPRVNTVTLRKDNISCMLPRYTGVTAGSNLLSSWRQQQALPLTSTDHDYCDGEADMELNYQIDMFGSKVVKKEVNGRLISTEAGKYFVVTVSPDAQAGSGWHIADDLQRNRDFSTAIGAGIPGTARGESLGPLVNRYQFWIRKPADSEVQLVEKFPANKDRQVSINETRGVVAGITGTITGLRSINNAVGGSNSNTNGSSSSNTNGSASSNTNGNSIGTTTGTSNSATHETSNSTAVTTGEKSSTTVTNGSKDSNTSGSSSSTTTGTNVVNGNSSTNSNNNSSTNANNSSNTTAATTNNSTTGQVTSQLAGAIQQSNNRTLSYTGTEYTIENKSSTKIAKWIWALRIEDDRERICDFLVKKDLNTCFYTMPLLDSGWIINANKFTSATYANFVPAFQAVFKAAPKFAKTSTFEFGASVELASFVGATQPAWSPQLLGTAGNLVPGVDGIPAVISSLMPDIQRFSADLKTGPVQSVTESFTVDWDQPYFAPEANIRLQVISQPVSGVPETLNTLCLSANFNANTNANVNAGQILADTQAEARDAVSAAGLANDALAQAISAESVALAALQSKDTPANLAAYNTAVATTASRRTQKTAADAAVVRANTAVRVAEERAVLSNAKVPTATFETCNNKKEQVWGYDAEEKLFKSRAVKGAEYCLAYPNLDQRLANDDTLVATPERNSVEIWPCSGLDNRQKWVLQDDGYLRTYTGTYPKLLGYGVETRNAKDRYGDLILRNGNYVVERLPHTGMTREGNLQKKIQAFPVQF